MRIALIHNTKERRKFVAIPFPNTLKETIFVADVLGFAEENRVLTDVYSKVADAFERASDEHEMKEIFRVSVRDL